MGFRVSPGLNISEVDLTTVTPAIATTTAAIAGVFNWGPIGKLISISNETLLVSNYGKPTNSNYETWFSAANFLSYSNNLMVSRAAVVSSFSNTLTLSMSGNTTSTIASVNTGITTGRGVYGAGIANGTVVSNVSSNATHTIITLSSNALVGNSTVASDASINFYDTNYCFSAFANSSAVSNRSSYLIKNKDVFDEMTFSAGVEFVAKYPGDMGNSLKVSVCETAEQFSSTVNPFELNGFTNSTAIPSTAGISLNVSESTANVYISNSATLNFATTYNAANQLAQSFIVGDYIEVGNTTIGKQYLKIKSISGLSNTNPLSPTGQVYFNINFEQPYNRSTNFTSNTINRKWEFFDVVNNAPGTSNFVSNTGSSVVDELSIVITDNNGKFTGTSGSILEIYDRVSRATDAINDDGTTNFFKTVLNNNSKYLWVVNDLPNAPSANASTVINSTAVAPYSKQFNGGTDGFTESTAPMLALANAIDILADDSLVDVSLLIAGKTLGTNGVQVANYLIDNVAEVRKDCVVFISPQRSDVVGSGVEGSQATNAVNFRNNIRNSSYAFIDSGYKYQYDKYNDVLRYIPLNGDIAGIAARTDSSKDPWWSFAGFNRGQVKNLIKLAWSPSESDRNILYKSDINPVVTFQGQGTILYGDKTALGRASAFDRINVRRLFIVLEKTIASAGKQMIFEFNDEFTRAQFKNLVEPFLRDVQGRRGIQAYKVVCDETNNTGEVIDSNRFVGDIYIKPSKSINFIQLNFVAVGSSVEFSEVVGKF